MPSDEHGRVERAPAVPGGPVNAPPDARLSLAQRLIRLVLRAVVPLLGTAVAATLGYVFAVYPIWYHVAQVRKTETLGGLMTTVEGRKAALGAYFEDSGLDASSFDHLEWGVPTVMTPFVGYAPAPGQRHNARIDRHQFRGDRELTVPKSPGVIRVFLTGASVAFSAGAASDERTIGGYLQRMLDERGAATGRRYDVFTFATPAWSSTHERIAIENRISDLEPDLVIDLTGLADAFYGERGNNVLWARALTDQYYWDLVNIALRRVGLGAMEDVTDVSPVPVPPATVAARFHKNVLLAARALSLSKSRYHVFLQPAVVTTRKPLSGREKTLLFARAYFANPAYYRSCYDAINSAFDAAEGAADVEYTDVSRIFDALSDHDEVFLDSYHFGDRGNYLISRAIVDALEVAGAPGSRAPTGTQ